MVPGHPDFHVPGLILNMLSTCTSWCSCSKLPDSGIVWWSMVEYGGAEQVIKSAELELSGLLGGLPSVL